MLLSHNQAITSKKGDICDDIFSGTRFRAVLLHGTGVGKTFAALELGARMVKAYKISAVLFTTPSGTTHNPLKNSNGLGERLILKSFHSLALMAQKHPVDADLRRELFDTLLVIDEVHNLRENITHPNNPYPHILRIMTVIDPRRTKTMFLSATPVRDCVYEIYNLARLVDPFATRHMGDIAHFRSEHMASEYSLRESSVKIIQRILYPHVSFESCAPLPVQVVDVGVPVPPLLNTPVVEHAMSCDETRTYNVALASTSNLLHVEAIRSCTAAAMFQAMIASLVAQSSLGQKSFVYSNVVNNDGLSIQTLCKYLENNGFKKFSARQKSRFKYIEITGAQDKNALAKAVNSFNRTDNINGKNISVIIGSRLVSESFNLAHVRHVHIMTPFWNETQTSQAVGRAARMTSHADLPPDEWNVSVTRHVCVPCPCHRLSDHFSEYDGSVTKYMYAVSERKKLGTDLMRNALCPQGDP